MGPSKVGVSWVLGCMLPLRSLPTGLVDTCRECGARALVLMGQLQDRQALPQAQPGLVRGPLQGVLQLGQVRCGWGMGDWVRSSDLAAPPSV